jgi:alcohol dehydrogenase
LLRQWTETLALKRLGHFGVDDGRIETIVANSRGSSMQTNPIPLTDDEIAEIVKARL